jgi:isopentenyl-diphosphate delta-isomerase
MEQQLVLVNERDEVTGTAGKLETHQKGLLHRAFSIFIFNTKGEMLLQQRSHQKYHSGGLWSNACCSHPLAGEDLKQAAIKRLAEEMGFKTELFPLFHFIYKAEFDNGLTEYEFDHVFMGEYDGPVGINEDEVMDFSFKTMEEIKNSLLAGPQNYTAWFIESFPKIEEWWRKKYEPLSTRTTGQGPFA